MMNPTSPERVRQDCRLIRQTLLKLAVPRLIIRAIVIAVAVIIWLYVNSLIFGFGATVQFGFLQPLGQPTIDFLNRINPYIWWGVVVIWSLIVLFCVRGWLRSSMDSARGRTVPADTFALLVPELSDEVTDVMRWVWDTRDEPFTLGDLYRTLSETRSGRIDKIAMVREQEALLGAGPLPSPPIRGARGLVDDGRRAGRTDVRGELRADSRPDLRADRGAGDRDHPVEPRIGPTR
jgi:hypothetical protein